MYNMLMQDEGQWEFRQEGQASRPAEERAHWTASEFISHEKGMSWFLLLGVSTALLMLAVFFITRDIVSTIVVLFVAVMFGVYAVRQPKVREYSITNKGIQIDERQYTYGLFRSFCIIQDGGVRAIELLPMRRFMPILSIYVDPENEKTVVEALADYLPFEQREQAAVDKLMRRLRF